MVKNNKSTYLILAIIAISLIIGCEQTPPKFPDDGTQGEYDISLFEPNNEISALNFKSIDEYNNFIKKKREGNSGYLYGSFAKSVMVQEEALDMSSSRAPAAGPIDYSKTNVQVEGIDEADIIKTDGTYIYTVSNNILYIIDAYPGEDAKIVYSKKMEDRSQIQGLFVEGDNLAVFGNFNDPAYFKKIGIKPYSGMTFFNIYDISNKEEPELIKEYKFEGNYFQSRMKGDYIYFVTNVWPQYRRDYPTPLILEGDSVKSVPIDNVYYFPIPYDSPMLSTIHSINLNDPEQDVNSKSLVLEGSQNMFMSENNIYITYSKYINEWGFRKEIIYDEVFSLLSDSDKSLIEKIKDVDDSIMSQYEKDNKISGIINEHMTYYLTQEEQEDLYEEIDVKVKKKLKEYDYLEYTVVHRVSIDNGDIEVEANGKVPGHIINQFSMDEFDNVFRIATTVNPRFDFEPMVRGNFIGVDAIDVEPSSSEDVIQIEKSSNPSRSIAIMPQPRRSSTENNIYTLNQDLYILDSLTGLAEGETIQSTRFIGNRLYMVTFRQVDPFFVIDLSNPNKIKELGKLKIPGFSRYLHPYDKDTIIGIGRDATESGRTEGLKISLFDVSDVENPKETAKFVTKEKYAQSTAEFEHKAFLFSKEKELLVIPAYNYNYNGNSADNGEGYNGAMVFKITKDDIELRGIIDHSQGIRDYYGAMVERSLYIEELLYTKSPSMLRINNIEDLGKVKNIELKSGEGPYKVY